jgi:hypothetical protein
VEVNEERLSATSAEEIFCAGRAVAGCPCEAGGPTDARGRLSCVFANASRDW